MRRIAAAGALLVLAAACNESQIASGSDVTIGGSVERQDGSRVSGARVALMREADAGDVFVGVVSIGLSCLEHELSECGETRLATTSGDGSFEYRLKGRDTQGRFGTASIMELTTAAGRGDGELAGAGVSTRFQVQTERVGIPLRVWTPPVDVVGAGRIVRTTWTDPQPAIFPSGADLGDLRRWVVFQASEDEAVWRATAGAGALELDARILEDSRGGVQVFSTVDDIKTSPELGTDVEVLLRSARIPYTSSAGRPVSRGKPCFVADAAGQPVSQASCTLTDGRFDAPFHPVTCPTNRADCREPTHTAAWVDLGAPTDVTFVVVRGCSGACTVEASEDAASWRTLGAGRGEEVSGDIAVAPGRPMRVRYVRVSPDGSVGPLREISVWDPTPVSVQGSLRAEIGKVDRGLVPQGPSGGSSRGWLLPLIAGGLAVAAVAVLFAVRRRRASAPAAA